MPRQTIAAKIAPELKQQINQLAAASEINPSRVEELAIEKYLGIHTDAGPLSQLQQMEGEIEQLRQQSAEFERAIAELQQWRERLKRRGF